MELGSGKIGIGFCVKRRDLRNIRNRENQIVVGSSYTRFRLPLYTMCQAWSSQDLSLGLGLGLESSESLSWSWSCRLDSCSS